MKSNFFSKVQMLDDSLWIYKNIEKPEFKTLANKWSKESYYLRILYCFFSIVKKIKFSMAGEFKPSHSESLLYINSENTRRVLEFLNNEKTSEIFQHSGVSNNNFHFSFGTILSLPFAYIFALFLDFKFYIKYPDLFFENWGKLDSNLRYLSQQKYLRRVFFSNDHNVHNRLFLHACKLLKIQTIYLQHAPVSKFFPPLSFDLAFLFGEVDLASYSDIGIDKSSKVELVGMPSFDHFYKKRKLTVSETPKVVGVSLNLIDDLKLAEVFIKDLSKFYKVIVRFHPRDKRGACFPFKNVTLSDANVESPFEYLLNLDFHLAGNSGIHLESVLLNVPSFYLKISENEIDDYYGFVKHGVIKEVTSVTDLLDYKLKQSVYMAAKPFSNTVGSSYEGSSQQLIKERLNLES